MRIEFARRRPSGYVNPPTTFYSMLVSLVKEHKNHWRRDPVLVRIARGRPDSLLSTVGVIPKTAKNYKWYRLL